MSDPDMSYLCRGWTPTQAYPATVATLPRGRDLTLSVICENVARNPYHPIRLLTARAEGIDLWAIDLLISGELLVGEYRKPPKVLPALGGDRLQISLSYSPTSGGFALCANAMNGEEGASMSASNVGRLPLPATYELVIGADKMAPFSEVSPLGWIITAQHDLARPIVDGEPAEDWRLREGPLPVTATASAPVQTNPQETLELALNSIEHWLKVARSAMEEVKPIKLTLAEIMDTGKWDEFCELRGWNPWTVNEGIAHSGEEVELSDDEVRLLLGIGKEVPRGDR